MSFSGLKSIKDLLAVRPFCSQSEELTYQVYIYIYKKVEKFK